MEDEVVIVDEGGDDVGPIPDEDQGDVGSSITMERVEAAKKFIENHYRSQMKHIQERKERYIVLFHQTFFLFNFFSFL